MTNRYKTRWNLYLYSKWAQLFREEQKTTYNISSKSAYRKVERLSKLSSHFSHHLSALSINPPDLLSGCRIHFERF